MQVIAPLLKETDQIVLPETLVINPAKPGETVQYVPILKVLQKVLSYEDVFEHICNRQSSTDKILQDYPDGELFQFDPFFLNNHCAFICMPTNLGHVNAIGADRGMHKMSAFYYTIGNLHPSVQPCIVPLINLI